MTPTSVEDLFRTACGCHQAGDLVGAERGYQALLRRRPDHADALHLLGLVLSQTGRPEEGLAAVRRAIALQPGDATFHNNLAEIHRRADQLDEAVLAYQSAIAIRPGFPEAHFNLANVLKTQGKHEPAIESYRRAVQLRPGYAKAHFNLANTLREYGLVKASVEAYQKALAITPDWPDAVINLANAQADLGETDQAIVGYQRALALAPDRDDLHLSLGGTYLTQGRIAEARACYARAAQHRPDRWLHRLRSETLCEIIPPSSAYVDDYRGTIIQTLGRYADEARSLDLATLHSSGAEPPMALAYHGMDDRAMKEAYAKLFTATLPTPVPPAGRKGGPVHVGLVVTHGHEGVFYKCLGGIVHHLPCNDLQLTLVCSRAGANILRQWVKNPLVRYLVLPERIDQAAESIRAAGIDHLHYWEVGTDSTNYFLPFLRPAAVQSTTWGWPVTSGNPAIDFFVSAESLEPEEGTDHYTEKLVRLKSLPTCYARPPVPEVLKPRSAFGLGDSQHVYVCQQNLRKVQPAFDLILADILRTDSAGIVLLIADAQPRITALLQERLRRSAPDVADRIRIVPRLPEPAYLNLVAVSDVVLDTPGYGGGANTAYDAMACGTPTVTWPGRFHRGRWCAAVNRRIGLEACVANSPAEYVTIATRIGKDEAFGESLSLKIRSATPSLFDTTIAAEELRAFFLRTD